MEQTGTVIALVSRVTAPVNAMARPYREAVVFIVILTFAIIVPTNVVDVPSVAETPTCQYLLHQFAGALMTTTDEPLAVVRVLPI